MFVGAAKTGRNVYEKGIKSEQKRKLGETFMKKE